MYVTVPPALVVAPLKLAESCTAVPITAEDADRAVEIVGLFLVQVWTLEELLPGTLSTSLPVTVAVLVKQVPLVEGAVPVRLMVKIPALASAPSEHRGWCPSLCNQGSMSPHWSRPPGRRR